VQVMRGIAGKERVREVYEFLLRRNLAKRVEAPKGGNGASVRLRHPLPHKSVAWGQGYEKLMDCQG
jgi:hypothetical protein